MKISQISLLSATLLAAASASAQFRKETQLDTWLFSRDSLSWQTVSVPHDWAIAGPFDKKHDLQLVAIEQNGETEKTEKSGRSGALPWIGRGFYTTTVDVPKAFGRAILTFDGAMAEPVVRINGRVAGEWKYGYNAFTVDATNYLTAGRNVITVSLNNREESSRWYPGAGLYRPVTLTFTAEEHIDTWDSWFRTLRLGRGKAEVAVSTTVAGLASPDGLDGGSEVRVEVSLLAPDGTVAASAATPSLRPATPSTDAATTEMKLTVAQPQLWSPETPALYTLVRRVFAGTTLLDETRERVGIRTVSVSKKGGFQLNGQTRKIQGVCLHHDLGPLGAAVNKSALIRQIRLLKEMGADAIRTAHNMPSEMQMQVCDSMGMMVMAETFDMWRYPKCKNGYAVFFDDWADRDVENLARRHRNHPAIVMWSIGNEIPEQWSQEGVEISRRLQDIFHRFDPTRPVTQGMDRAEDALKSGFAQVMDVPGFNYRVHKYDTNIRQLPQGFLLGSETASTVSSRGVYHFPVEATSTPQHDDLQTSSYDVEYCSWSNLPDDDWAMQDDRSYTIGEFVWTGFDYLGEPTPYDEAWPSRSSYFGILDLAGLPKDRYYLYRARWNKTAPTLHILPHWTWPGREGQTTPVYAYTSYDEAELFVNGVSKGRIRKNAASRLDRYRLRWNNVTYEPGEIRVVAYDAQGRPAAEASLQTAGAPHHLRLEADRASLSGNGADLAFVTVTMVDAQGRVCPHATAEVTFSVSGAGRYKAACNGDATSLVSFASERMPLFSGAAVAVVEGAGKGVLRLTASAAGLPDAEIEIEVK